MLVFDFWVKLDESAKKKNSWSVCCLSTEKVNFGLWVISYGVFGLVFLVFFVVVVCGNWPIQLEIKDIFSPLSFRQNLRIWNAYGNTQRIRNKEKDEREKRFLWYRSDSFSLLLCKFPYYCTHTHPKQAKDPMEIKLINIRGNQKIFLFYISFICSKERKILLYPFFVSRHPLMVFSCPLKNAQSLKFHSFLRSNRITNILLAAFFILSHSYSVCCVGWAADVVSTPK